MIRGPRNKFELELRAELVRNKVDLLIISETKLVFSWDAQFYIELYSKPYILTTNSKDGGIILYVREDIPFKLTNSSCIDQDKDEIKSQELNRRK